MVWSYTVQLQFGGGGIGIYGMAVLAYFSYGISVFSLKNCGITILDSGFNFGFKNCGITVLNTPQCPLSMV